MNVTIERARKAVQLRARLDGIDLSIAATPSPQGWSVYFNFPQPQGNPLSKTVKLSDEEVAAVMECRHRRLAADRLMILAEAAEAGLTIEDAPKPPPAAQPEEA